MIDTWIQHTLLGLHLLWLDELELHTPARPGDGPGVGRVVQQGDQELPQLERAATSWTWKKTVVGPGTNSCWTWKQETGFGPGKTGGPGWPPGPPGPQLVA